MPLLGSLGSKSAIGMERRTVAIAIWDQRQLQKSGSRRNEPALVPWLKLSGRWLELAGFKPQQLVRIEVRDGRLVITHA
jgi:toxic protein SymE